MPQSGRLILAIVLMVAVMVVTNILFPPAKPTQPTNAAGSARVDSLLQKSAGASTSSLGANAAQPVTTAGTGTTTAATGDTSKAIGASATNSAVASPAANAAPAPDTIFVSSDLYRYGFSTNGAALVSAQMLKHTSRAKATLNRTADLAAIGGHPLISYKLNVGDNVVDLSTLAFQPVPAGDVKVAADAQQLRMVHTDSSGGYEVEIDYSFTPAKYLIDAHAVVRNIGSTPTKLLIEMGPTLAATEADSAEDARHRAYVVNGSNNGMQDVTFLQFSRQGATQMENGPFNWVALRSKYFISAILESNTTKTPFGGVQAKPVPGRHGADLTTTLPASKPGDFSFRMYVGPQEPKQLEAIGNGFKDVNPFGWRWARPILRPVGHGIAALLYGMHDLLGLSYGWVLIMFGVLIRVILWPLNAKAMRSQMKNMEMQPRIKDIQTRYKNDQARMQQEMLKLYKEENFNPMGGCLPMLIPWPILITLYFVFANAIAFRGVPFLWLPDLSRPDPLYILPVLLGVSMFVLQWFSTRGMSGDQNQQMKVMMYTMPPFMTFIFMRFAAGLNLYYAAMNIASIPQQMQIMRERERMKNRANGVVVK